MYYDNDYEITQQIASRVVHLLEVIHSSENNIYGSDITIFLTILKNLIYVNQESTQTLYTLFQQHLKDAQKKQEESENQQNNEIDFGQDNLLNFILTNQKILLNPEDQEPNYTSSNKRNPSYVFCVKQFQQMLQSLVKQVVNLNDEVNQCKQQISDKEQYFMKELETVKCAMKLLNQKEQKSAQIQIKKLQTEIDLKEQQQQNVEKTMKDFRNNFKQNEQKFKESQKQIENLSIEIIQYQKTLQQQQEKIKDLDLSNTAVHVKNEDLQIKFEHEQKENQILQKSIKELKQKTDLQEIELQDFTEYEKIFQLMEQSKINLGQSQEEIKKMNFEYTNKQDIKQLIYNCVEAMINRNSFSMSVQSPMKINKRKSMIKVGAITNFKQQSMGEISPNKKKQARGSMQPLQSFSSMQYDSPSRRQSQNNDRTYENNNSQMSPTKTIQILQVPTNSNFANSQNQNQNEVIKEDKEETN